MKYGKNLTTYCPFTMLSVYNVYKLVLLKQCKKSCWRRLTSMSFLSAVVLIG